MRLTFLLTALVSVLATVAARAEVRVTPKHLIIVRPGVDTIWGSYVFAVQNDGPEPETFKSKIMLPKETVDFVPQEGLTPDQISLDKDGGVLVEGKFPNGVHIVSIGFKVDGRFGQAKLTISPVHDVQSFTVLVPRGSPMTVSSPVLTKAEDGASPDPQYESLIGTAPLTVGTTYTIEAAGIPEGRLRIWIIGGSVGAIMLLLAALLALRTRPKITGAAGEAVLVG